MNYEMDVSKEILNFLGSYLWVSQIYILINRSFLKHRRLLRHVLRSMSSHMVSRFFRKYSK